MRRLAIFMATTVLAVPVNGAAQETSAFLYDVHGRLTSVTRATSGASGQTTSYVYDAADNRTQRSVTLTASRAASDDNNSDGGESRATPSQQAPQLKSNAPEEAAAPINHSSQ